MIRLLLLFIWSTVLLNAAANFETSKVCQKCHPVIYDEFYDSSHRKSSIHTDPIHKAVWDKHPLKSKEKYSCSKCHTPSDTELMQNLADGKSAVPKNSPVQTEEGVSCISCHMIDHVEEHAKTNKNVMSTREKTLFSAREGRKGEKDVSFNMKTSFFGLITEKSGSPYHKIDYSNQGFYDGKMCMGCHSHKQNAHQFDVCETDAKADAQDEKNCISCHMPMIKGNMNTVHETQQHRYHGFPGASHQPKMLSEYVHLELEQTDTGFTVSLKNDANHALFLHPLRLAELQVSVERKGEVLNLKSVTFVRVIGKDGKATMPWLANAVVKDSQIQAKESRQVPFLYHLTNGDVVEMKIGFYRVNPKAASKLGLEAHKEVSSFTLLKKARFKIKK